MVGSSREDWPRLVRGSFVGDAELAHYCSPETSPTGSTMADELIRSRQEDGPPYLQHQAERL